MNGNRCLVLLFALISPITASAFQEKTITLQGVSVTAIASSTRACGVEFVIAVADGNQHFVKIDYSYNGEFTINGRQVPMQGRGTRNYSINASVGRNTMDGNLARRDTVADLDCSASWIYSFTASATNMSKKK